MFLYKIKERLPEEGKEVLFVDSYNNWYSGSYQPDTNFVTSTGSVLKISQVLGWMKLPNINRLTNEAKS